MPSSDHPVEGHSPVASPLQPAESPRGAAKWLGFQSTRAHYLLLLAHAGEVLQAADVTKVPFTQPWFRGVVSVRGGLLGVVDVDGFLAVHATDSPDPAAPTGDTMHHVFAPGPLVTLSPALQPPCALAMGTLVGLRGTHDFDAHEPDGDLNNPLVSCVYEDRSHTRWIEIHLPALIASARMRPVAMLPGAT